jgi:hypothetical protein
MSNTGSRYNVDEILFTKMSGSRYDSDEDQRWYKEGKQHRDGDLPAIILANGPPSWYKEGKRIA